MDTKTESEKPAEKKSAKPLWKRSLKWALWSVAGLLAFVLVAVLTLPLWINPVATSVAKLLVPEYTGTAFDIKNVELNPYTGKMLISGVELANPEGYSEKDAFKLGKITADVEVSSLLSKTIHVREVTVEALSASYVFDAGGTNNFDRIVATVNEKLGPKKEKKEEPSETKVVIDKVTVKNVHVIVGTAVFDLESLTLADFGRDDKPAKLVISGVRLTNPPGFEAENAFSLGSFSVGVETGDLGKLPIKIHDIVIDSPYASYVFDEKNMDNFTRMLEPLLAKGGAAEEKPKEQGAAKKEEKKPAAPAGSPVTLDRLEVKNLKAQVCKGRFELASLVVTDFGKPTAAMVKLEGVKLVNPDGFKAPNAFSLGSLSVALETADLSKKPMALHDITLKSLYAGYVFNGAGASNIDVMFKPLMESGKKDGGKGEVAVADTAEKEKKEASDKGGLPVVVDKVVLEDVRADVGTGQFELQSLNLVDLGKDTPMKLEISGVKLMNPPGFETEKAFSLGSLTLGMDMRDLGKLPIKIHDIVIDSPYASYVFDGENKDNFTRMLEPLLAKGGAAEGKPKDQGAAKKDEKKPAASAGSPVTLDRLEVKNLKAQVCKGRVELASLVVTDFGKPTAAMVKLEGAKLVNPDGFKQPNAFSLGSLSVALETADLSKKPMALHDITLKSLYAGYVFNDAGASNIDVMFKPLMGGGKKDDGKSEVVVADTAEDGKKEESGKGGLPVVVDKVALEDVRADVGAGKFELQSLTLSDVGKETPAKLEISGVKLVNPPGFETANAFSLGSLSVGVETGDPGKLPIKVHSVVVDSPYASYVFDEKGVDNITRMLEPLLAQGEAAKPKEEKKDGAQKEEKKPAGPSPSPVTLDRLEVRNLKAQACKGRFELASLVVTDFGTTNTLVSLEDAKLVHPPEDGFHEPNSFAIKSLNVGIETDDLSKKPMVFHDIVVDSPYAGLFLNKDWDHNFKVMFRPLMDDGKKEKKEEKVAADEKKAEEKKDEGKKDDDSSRVVIDKLEIKGLWLQLLRLPIKQPDIFPIRFTDIGKQSEKGATVKEVAAKVGDRVMEIVPGPVAGFVKNCYESLANPNANMKDVFDVDAMKVLGGASDFLTAGATNVLGGAKDFVTGGTTNLLGGTTNLLGGAKGFITGGTTNLLGGAKDFVSGGATNVLGGATEKLGSAVNATKGLIGGLLPGGDKKDDAKKDDAKKKEDEKKEDGKNVDKKDGEEKEQ